MRKVPVCQGGDAEKSQKKWLKEIRCLKSAAKGNILLQKDSLFFMYETLFHRKKDERGNQPAFVLDSCFFPLECWDCSDREMCFVSSEQPDDCACGASSCGRGLLVPDLFSACQRAEDIPDSIAPDRLRVLVEESDSFGISLHGKSVILRGKGRALADLTDEFLALLDTKFPYYGYYGEQTPMLPWDYTSTSEQRRLQEKTQVVGKTLSVKTAVTEFNQWLKESGADVHEGF